MFRETSHAFSRRDFLKGLGAMAVSPKLEKFAPKEVLTFNSTVLYYHEINPFTFKSELKDLIRKGFKPLGLEAFARSLQGDDEIRKDPTFLLTWDDGRLSQYTQGLQALNDIQDETGVFVPVTFFPIIRFEGNLNEKLVKDVPDETPSFIDGRNRFMTVGQLKEILTYGHSIGSHTVNHGFLNKMSPENMQNELKFGESRVNQIYKAAKIERKVKVIAYPNGAYGQREIDFLSGIDCDAAFTTLPTIRHNSTLPFSLGRIRKS